MIRVKPLIGIRPGARSVAAAALATALMVAASLPAPLSAAAGQPRPAPRHQAAQASGTRALAAEDAVRMQQRWLPLREALRILRREPREMLLLVHPQVGTCADELRQKLTERGYHVDVAMAAEGNAPILELLRTAGSRASVPPMAVVLPGAADISAATPLPQYAHALDEILLSLISRGARIHTVVLATPPAASEMARGYRARMFLTARERGALVADITGTPSPEAACDALVQLVLAASAPHPSLFVLPLFPILSLAILWLWRRSRFRVA